MKRNSTELEQRLIMMLKKNSRMNIIDMSRELGVSRITAKKAFDSLVDSGRIKNFTITLDEDEKDMVLVHVENLEEIPINLIVEYFKLIDNTYIAVLYYEDLMKVKDADIKKIEIAKSRKLNESISRAESIHCDYCQNEIRASPIIVKLSGKTYYACCPNCERDLRKRREIISSQENQ